MQGLRRLSWLRWGSLCVLLGALGLVASHAVYDAWLAELVASAFEGHSPFPELNARIAKSRSWDPESRDLAFYVGVSRGFLGRTSALLAMLACVAVMDWRTGVLRRMARAALVRADSPFNLALARVLVFGLLAWMVIGFAPTISEWSARPEQTVRPPLGFGWVLSLLPLRLGLAPGACTLAAVSSVAAAAGLAYRVTAPIAVLSSVYAIGVVFCFYQVDHHSHHLVWFGAILASAPAADVLSFDALARAWGDPATSLHRPERALRYGVPLRVIWLLFGLIYLFPGAWKLLVGGTEWFLSDHLRNHLYWKWFDGYEPPVRIDAIPLVWKSMALATIVFELGFVVLVFTRLRVLMVVSGLLFHYGVFVFMGIRFIPLMACYPVLLDMYGWLVRAARAVLGSAPAAAIAPPGHAALRKHALLRSVDLLGRLPPLASLTPGPHASARSSVVPGVLIAPPPAPPVRVRSQRRGLSPAFAFVATALVGGNSLMGVANVGVDGWPLSSYPKFANLAEAHVYKPRVVLRDAAGRETAFDHTAMRHVLNDNQMRGLLVELRPERPGELRDGILRGLASEWAEGDPRFAQALHAARELRVDWARYSVLPRDRDHALLSTRTLATLRLTGP